MRKKTRSPCFSLTVLNARATKGSLVIGGGNLFPRITHVRGVVFILVPKLHPDQVDDAFEFIALAGRDRADGRDDIEFALHLLDAAEEIGAHAVELVDERNARHAMLV